MGQARIRKLTDPSYGQPLIYTLELFKPCNSIAALQLNPNYYLLLELPYSIPRQRSPIENRKKAIADAGTIMSYLIDPKPDRWKLVEKLHSIRAQRLSAVADKEAIESLPNELPIDFWGWIRDSEGDLIRSIDGENSIVVTLAKSDRSAPDQGIKHKSYSPEAFYRRAV